MIRGLHLISARLALAEERIDTQDRIIAELTRRLDAIARPHVLGPTEKQASTARIDDIVAKVARAHGFAAEDLIGPSRVPDLCRARDEAVHLLRAAGFSTPRIGRYLGGRDASTIMTASARHRKLLKCA